MLRGFFSEVQLALAGLCLPEGKLDTLFAFVTFKCGNGMPSEHVGDNATAQGNGAEYLKDRLFSLALGDERE
jgi:hypothetical protein